jgi:hypothetical protein
MEIPGSALGQVMEVETRATLEREILANTPQQVQEGIAHSLEIGIHCAHCESLRFRRLLDILNHSVVNL